MRVSPPLTLSRILILSALVLFAPASRCFAEKAAVSLFDPAKHMRVDEVKPGMKGYGLTVFQGTKVERFDVEVISILRNFNPKYDAVLIKCFGDQLMHTGAVAGMSGSPIYLYDDGETKQHARMIGAFAYGWPLTKDPIAGVQPIEYMLSIPTTAPTTNQTAKSGDGGAKADAAQGSTGEAEGRAHMRWSLDEAIPLPGAKQTSRRYPFKSWNDFSPNPRLSSGFDADLTTLRPLATPMMTAGLSAKMLEQLAPIFRTYGIEPVQGGGSAASGAGGGDAVEAKLEPGGVLAVPLLSGDVEMTAIGTCTEVIGDRVFGFGHAFNNEGPITMPMGSGQIHTVIANLATSFKLGSLAQTRGTLVSDQTVGVAGRSGEQPPMVPIELRVVYTDGTLDRTYNFRSALHPRFTPLISAAAIGAALSSVKDLPQYHTLEYDMNVEFANGRTIHVENTGVNAGAAELFFEVGAPMIAASDNPFERVMVKKLSGKITVRPEAREAQILSVNIPRQKYRPGETVKGYVVYRPFRAGEATLPVTFDLPHDLPEGQYQLTVCDWEQYLLAERAANPFRFTAEKVDDVFAVMKDFTSIRHDALYLRLMRQPDGVAIGRTAMQHLPSSRRQVIMGSGRSNTTAFVSSTVKIVPTDRVMSGNSEFAITIDKDAKVEVGGPGGKKEPAQAAPGGKAEPAKPNESPKNNTAAPSEAAPEK